MRLQVSPLASLAMVSGLLLVAAAAIALVPTRAHDLKHKVRPIGSIAIIMKESPDLNLLLKGCGQKSMEGIKKTLKPFTFQSMTTTTRPSLCSIVPRLENTAKSSPTELPPEESITWSPIPLRPWIFASTSDLFQRYHL